MSKKVALVEFNSRFSAIVHYDDGSVDKVPEYIPDMGDKVKELLGRGVKIEATSRPSRTLLEELLGTIPLPDEEEEPRMVTRHVLMMKAGGKRSFVTNQKAVDYHMRYCSKDAPPVIEEMEVKA